MRIGGLVWFSAWYFLAVFISNNVLAQSSDTASGLRLAPLRSELIIEPGKSDTVSVKLKNVSGGAVIINSVVVDFKSNEDGSPSALPQSDEQLPTSIRSYLTPTDGVELAADAEYDYKLPLEVPQDTRPELLWLSSFFKQCLLTKKKAA